MWVCHIRCRDKIQQPMYTDLLYPTVGHRGDVEQVLVLVFRQDEVGEVLVGIRRTGTERWRKKRVAREKALELLNKLHRSMCACSYYTHMQFTTMLQWCAVILMYVRTRTPCFSRSV